MNINDGVKVKNTNIEGIIKRIDIYHPRITVKIEITKGKTPITDYYADELEII